ncbi:MAG: bifunctional diguanylate cyclase/phosphodiesterase [Ilumatobacter sp.]|uniref:putative bifunctional diguanylate cyclase/phosphodiesterase n=1 Tax=Ilumatobacter sp. TaxID=1967498 RepID=UPI003C742DE9
MTSAQSAPAGVHGTNEIHDVRADEARAQPQRSAVPATVAAVLFAVLIGIHATGRFGDTTYTLGIVSALVVGLVGLYRNRPALLWPWLLVVVTALLWGTASSLSSYDDFTNLSRTRDLTPDFVAIPGYFVFGIAMLGLLRARRPNRDITLALDGIVIAFGAALAVNHTLLMPTLELDGTWLLARLVVLAYPAGALILFAIAAQLAFAGGRRSPSFSMLLLGLLALTVCDVLWAFGEFGRFELSPNLVDAPYLIVPSSISVAMLHPSVSNISSPVRLGAPVRPMSRYVLVSSTLIVPPALIVLPGDVTPMTVMLSIGLCAAAALRVAHAMRSEDRSRAELLYRASHDDLTDLPTRSLLLDEIEQRLLAAEEPLALLFIDLDHFKNVNDLMGHQVGDELLVHVSERLVEAVRDADLVARISGDEFVVLAVGLDATGGSNLADRIRRTLSRPFTLDGGEVMCTASIGVSTADPGERITPSLLIQEADTAMYESKASRNETTVFDQSMQDRSNRRMEIERLLRHETDAPKLTAWFQPIVDTERGRVAGFEALLRWDALGTPISPAEFIPIAEDSGMIVSIGAFVLDEACRQAAYWRANVDNAEDLYVSVNVSARQIASPDIVDTVASCLERHGLPASALWLEITESVMTEDTAVTAGAMTGLRMLGVRLALDDFGTGYSSLSGLQYLPVSRLKIDRQFISGVGSGTANDKLVQCILAVAASFELDVVAEGVETREQLASLREIGCTQIQGYLFSKPVPADDVPKVFAQLDRRSERRRPHHRQNRRPSSIA